MRGATESLNSRCSKTVGAIQAEATALFRQAGIEGAEVDACLLLGHVLGLSRTSLLLARLELVPLEQVKKFALLIERRLRREPVAYILGTQEFWSLPFTVTPEVLVPRPETEVLIERIMDLYQGKKPHQRILDLGTGSGAIAVTLAHELPDAAVMAIDRQWEALAVARKNVETNGVAARVALVRSDWFGGIRLEPAFGLVVSNPPYIVSAVISTLEPEVSLHEPLPALDGGKDGLDAIRLIAGLAWRVLLPDGWLFMEIGSDQGAAVLEIMERADRYRNITILRDYADRDRIVQAQKS